MHSSHSTKVTLIVLGGTKKTEKMFCVLYFIVGKDYRIGTPTKFSVWIGYLAY